MQRTVVRAACNSIMRKCCSRCRGHFWLELSYCSQLYIGMTLHVTPGVIGSSLSPGSCLLLQSRSGLGQQSVAHAYDMPLRFKSSRFFYLLVLVLLENGSVYIARNSVILYILFSQTTVVSHYPVKEERILDFVYEAEQHRSIMPMIFRLPLCL